MNDIYSMMANSLLNKPEHVIVNRKEDTLNEMIDTQFTLLHPRKCFTTLRGMSFDYLKGELEFYMSGSGLLKDIAKHSKFWEKCSDDGVTINSNYGKLLLHDKNPTSNKTQFEYALSCLINNRDSKKAVMTVYSKENAYISNDNPCTMYLQFFIRNNKLDVYVKMRSSDIWFGLPYDVPFFVLIQLLMLKEIKKLDPSVSLGLYHHQAGSLHLYERNRQVMISAIVENGFRPEAQKELFNTYLLPYLKEDSDGDV